MLTRATLLALLLALTACGGGDIDEDPIDNQTTCTHQQCTNPR